MKAVPEIKEDYAKYKSICFDKKITKTHPVRFDQIKKSRPDFHYHESPLMHEYRTDEIVLMAEQKKLSTYSYKFQIRCEAYCKWPLFRFDSDGLSHQNKSKPLGEQQILTPHFNSFDENGKSIAYHTDNIFGVTCEELKDINKFFEFFCEECNILRDDETKPVIQGGDPTLLNFDIDSADPLIDINFSI